MCGCQLRNDEHTLNYLKIMCECQRSYNALSCSCPRLGDRMLSMFCLTASYSRIRFFRLPYSAYNRSFSLDSLEYSSRSLARSGSLSPMPAAFSARADASKRMISRSRPRRYFSLSRDFLYHLSNFCKKDIWKNQLAANAFWISFSNDSENLSSSFFVLFFGPFRCALLEFLRAFLFRCRSISIRSMLSFVYHFPD